MNTNLRFQITNPCEAAWDNMQQNDLGGFCLSCNKQVVDFSAMTTDQVIAFWQQPANHQFTCGRFTQDQLNKGFDVDVAWHLSPLIKRAAAVTIIGLSMAGLPIELHAQEVTPKSNANTNCPSTQERIEVMGEIGVYREPKKTTYKVSQVQSALEQKGYYSGAIDNVWGRKTKSALRKFKKANALPRNTKLDDVTLQLLGLMLFV